MGVLLLYLVGLVAITVGVILLFMNKSESQTIIKLRNWIGIQTNSTGFIMVFVGIVSIAIGMIKEEDRQEKTNTPISSVSVEKVDSIHKPAQDTESQPGDPIKKSVNAVSEHASGLSETTEKREKITRSFMVRSQSKTVLLRYVYKNIDTLYQMPVDLSLLSLKNLMIEHFYKDEPTLREGRILIYLDNRVVEDESKTLKEMKTRDSTIVHLEILLRRAGNL